MIRPASRLLALVTVLALAHGVALAGSGLQALFPQAAGPPVPDKSVTLTLPPGAVDLASVRFAPAPGQSQMFNTFWCGVVITSPGHAPQGLVVIGEPGPTEALSCQGLQAAGPMPPRHGAPRIGLLYRANSPNEESVAAAVITFDAQAGIWKNDDAATNYLTQIAGTPSLAWMRHALGHGDGG
jgi:hypothetical protein